MRGPSLAGGGTPVNSRADEWVAPLHPGISDIDKPGSFTGREVIDVEPERQGWSHERREVTGVAGREQARASGAPGGQRVEALRVRVRHARHDRKRLVQRCLRHPHTLIAEFQERQRITAGLAIQAICERLGELVLGEARRLAAAVAPSTPRGRDRRAVAEAGRRRRGAMARPPAPRAGRGPDLRPVDERRTTGRSRSTRPASGRRRRSQGVATASAWAASKLRVAAPMAKRSSDARRPKRQRTLESGGLRLRDAPERSQSRPEQLEQSRKWDLCLRLDAPSTKDVHVDGPVLGIRQKRRLADAGLPDDRKDFAATRPGSQEQLSIIDCSRSRPTSTAKCTTHPVRRPCDEPRPRAGTRWVRGSDATRPRPYRPFGTNRSPRRSNCREADDDGHRTGTGA